jgi:hypothetical protein
MLLDVSHVLDWDVTFQWIRWLPLVGLKWPKRGYFECCCFALNHVCATCMHVHLAQICGVVVQWCCVFRRSAFLDVYSQWRSVGILCLTSLGHSAHLIRARWALNEGPGPLGETEVPGLILRYIVLLSRADLDAQLCICAHAWTCQAWLRTKSCSVYCNDSMIPTVSNICP